MRILFFDTETTGNTPEDRLCQLAIKEKNISEPILNSYYNPGISIPAEASAVHHITNKMVADKPTFSNSLEYQKIKDLFESKDTIVVAHNAAFDVAMLEAEGIHPTHVICTLKMIRSIDTKNEFSNHRLQYLRYALEIELDVPAHDALADVLVLEKVFDYLLQRVMSDYSLSIEDALVKMEEVSSKPLLIREFNFGKYKGKTVEEVFETAPDYLQWLLEQKQKDPNGEEDWIYTLKNYLDK